MATAGNLARIEDSEPSCDSRTAGLTPVPSLDPEQTPNENRVLHCDSFGLVSLMQDARSDIARQGECAAHVITTLRYIEDSVRIMEDERLVGEARARLAGLIQRWRNILVGYTASEVVSRRIQEVRDMAEIQ